MEASGLHTIRDYIMRLQETISEKLAFLPIHEIFSEAEWMPVMSQIVIWWDQDVVNEPEE